MAVRTRTNIQARVNSGEGRPEQQPRLKKRLKEALKDKGKQQGFVELALRNPHMPLEQVALKAGFEPWEAQNIAERFVNARTEGRAVQAAERERRAAGLSDDVLLNKFEKVITLGLDALTEDRIEKFADVRPDRVADMVATSFDRRRVMMGQPTQIVDVNQRMELVDLGNALLSEVQRRAALSSVIDVEARDVTDESGAGDA